jgi:hypothetical protein
MRPDLQARLERDWRAAEGRVDQARRALDAATWEVDSCRQGDPWDEIVLICTEQRRVGAEAQLRRVVEDRRGLEWSLGMPVREEDAS